MNLNGTLVGEGTILPFTYLNLSLFFILSVSDVLFPDDFHQRPLLPSPVELAVENLLPETDVAPALRGR